MVVVVGRREVIVAGNIVKESLELYQSLPSLKAKHNLLPYILSAELELNYSGGRTLPI